MTRHGKSRYLARLLVTWIVLALGACGGGGGSKTGNEQTPNGGTPSLRAGVLMVTGAQGQAIVGQPYQTRLGIVAADSQNPIASLAIRSSNSAGAPPAIDANGQVTWTPNESDFRANLQFTVTVTHADGQKVEVSTDVAVHRERLIHSAALQADTASYADPQGRYLVKIIKERPDAVIGGTLRILQIQKPNGSFVSSYELVGGDGLGLKVLQQPVSPEDTAAPATSGSVMARPLAAINYPLHLIAGLPGTHGSVIQAGTNVYSTRSPFVYESTKSGENKRRWDQAKPAEIFGFTASCDDAPACARTTRVPVILIHGFTPEAFGLGGGDGTWGELPQALVARGHAVFEMQWMTHMRFEEAAGALAQLVAATTRLTGRKPFVIAHSFGGIVTHLAMRGQGIVFDETTQSWQSSAVDVSSLVDRFVTLDSPLSGISDEVKANIVFTKFGNVAMNFTLGRDIDDRTINGCASVTCLQAGAFDVSDATIRLNVSRIDPSLQVGTAVEPGESIALLRVRQSSPGVFVESATPGTFLTYASMLQRPNDYIDNVDATDVYRLGDGLISLIGQAVWPEDFATSPYNTSKTFSIRYLANDTDIETFNTLQAGTCQAWESPAPARRSYRVCPRSGHTNSGVHSIGGKVQYAVAYYRTGDDIELESPARHPLAALMEDPLWLDRNSSTTTLPTRASSRLKWRTLTQTAGVIALPARVSLVRSSDRQVVFRQVLKASAQQDFDVAAALADSVGENASTGDHILRLELGGSEGVASYQMEFYNLSGIQDLADIDLTLRSSTSSLSGTVIDGQTDSTPVGGATIYLMKGVDQPVDQLENAVDTITSRRLMADANGAFSISGLEVGDYSLLVRKSGFLDQLQGRIAVDGSGRITVSLRRVLPVGQASITLRWAADGLPDVTSDLDSHLIRYAPASPVDAWPDLHVYYRNKADREAVLDRDDTSYEGPETITLTPQAGQRYVYYVHRFSSGGSLIGSEPRVYVQVGDVAYTFTPPIVASTARYWRVFELIDGQLTRCETAARCLLEDEPTR